MRSRAAALSGGGAIGTRRNFFGMHNLMDGGAARDEGMNWTRQLVGNGGFIFDWVRGDVAAWIEAAMDRQLVPCVRVQEDNGGATPKAGFAHSVASQIFSFKTAQRPEYADRLVYLQLWNEPGDPRDWVSPEDYADYLVEAHALIRQVDTNDTLRVMTPGQNGPQWWRDAIAHNPAVCHAFDVWATHPYPESYPPHYNHHDGVPFINQVKTIDSYLLDLDAVADECGKRGFARRGFPVMITETAYGDHLGIAYEGYPKTTRAVAAQYLVDAYTRRWHRWPEIVAVHPFLLNAAAWEAFAWVPFGATSKPDGSPTATYPQYDAVRLIGKPPPARLTPYRGPAGSIAGRVTRAQTDEPVRYATVYTDGYEFGGPTLFDGRYEVHDVPAGTYTLSVDKRGFGAASQQVVVADGATAVVDFALEYVGKVPRGLYFENPHTSPQGCPGCQLWVDRIVQSFVTPADVGFIKFAAAMPKDGGVHLRFTIHADAPDGPPVGDPVETRAVEYGGEMLGAEWPGDGVAVEPGRTYFLAVEPVPADGSPSQGMYFYATEADPYAEGMVHIEGEPRPQWDLYATIRGLTLEQPPQQTPAGSGDVAGPAGRDDDPLDHTEPSRPSPPDDRESSGADLPGAAAGCGCAVSGGDATAPWLAIVAMLGISLGLRRTRRLLAIVTAVAIATGVLGGCQPPPSSSPWQPAAPDSAPPRPDELWHRTVPAPDATGPSPGGWGKRERVDASLPSVDAPSPPPPKKKLGVHLLGSCSDPAVATLLAACPPVVKFVRGVCGKECLFAFRSSCPDSTIVMRVHVPPDKMGYHAGQDPVARADHFWSQVAAAIQEIPADQIDWLEGPNELDGLADWYHDWAMANWFAAFWDHLADLMHQAGYRPLVGSVATGNPALAGEQGPGSKNHMLPLADVIRSKPYLIGWSYHGYSSVLSQDPAVERYYSLRYRTIRDECQLQGFPLVLTEGGQDKPGGWLACQTTPVDYLDWLKWYDAEIGKDPEVVGVTLYQVGNYGDWKDFSLHPIAAELAGYIASP